MAYELFDNKAAHIGSPCFTILRSGKIAFNADAGDVLSRAGAKFAHFLWDSQACRLAVRPAEKRDDRAFKVSLVKGKRGGTFSGRSFLKYIQWHADGPIVVPASWNDREHLLEANLPTEHVGKLRTRTQEHSR
ncbi:MAG: hypothetical protein ABSF64_07790 [Bryobacteraceae bacterium]|jgi:hypothetical protein